MKTFTGEYLRNLWGEKTYENFEIWLGKPVNNVTIQEIEKFSVDGADIKNRIKNDILAQSFLRMAVEAESIDDFLFRFMRPDRYLNAKGKPKTHANDIVKHHKWNILHNGYTFLNEHDSITGYIVSYFP